MSARVGRLGVLVALLLALASALPSAAALAAPPASTSVAARLTPMAPPAITAKSAFVIDESVGTPLVALDADVQRAPASLTKIMTALVVLRHASLDDQVTIEATDLVDDSQSRVGLVAGDALSVRDLLAGLLIPSGNDAANALARDVGQKLFPSARYPEQATEAFVSEMNAIAAELGAANTHFVNPTGIDAEGHVSTARDIATIATEALRDQTFREFTSTRTMTLKSATKPEGYTIYTTNDLLVDGSVKGGKTGTTDGAGGCLLTYFDEGRNRVISVVLGSALEQSEDGFTHSSARFDDTRAIMQALSTEYRWVDPSSPDAFPGLADELVAWDAYLATGTDVPVPTGAPGETRYRLVLGPPADSDAPVGTVLFFVGTELVAERPVLQVG